VAYALTWAAARRILSEPTLAPLAAFSLLLLLPIGWFVHDDLTQSVAVLAAAAGTLLALIHLAAAPALRWYVALGLGLGLGTLSKLNYLLFAAALALEFLHDTIKTREDVRTKLQLACLGVVPRRRGKGNVVEELKDPSSPVSEAYSAVLASLRFSTEHGAPKIMLITSTEASEGKSSSAFALAQNYSRRGESVLLIDADLRRPAFRGASNRQGLTKLMSRLGIRA